MASLIVIAPAFTPNSSTSSSVPSRLGGELFNVNVPASAYCRVASAWFCQIQ